MIDLDDPIALLLATVTELTKAGLEHAVYGGLALAMYGEPRETKDADVAVAHVSLAAAQAALSRIGATVVPAFDSVPFGGLRISRLSLLGAGKLNTVDLVTPTSPGYAARVQARVLRGRLEGQELRVVSPEDFVVLKILSTREHDLQDARSVMMSLGTKLDRAVIIDEIRALAAELPAHDVVARAAAVGLTE